jgi:ABC-type transport system involved in cytochrome c biogenesis ATPase subunit
MLKIEHFALTPGQMRLMVIDELIVANGKKVLIFGDNEAGKTLFLRAIHSDFSKFAGTIHLKEKPISFYKKRKSTIFLGNKMHLLPNDTLWNNLVLPFEKLTKQQKIRIFEMLKAVELSPKIGLKVKNLSSSACKFIELIRAVVQQPQLILLDDFDHFFDEKKYLKALDICQFAISNGTSIIATAKNRLDHFDTYYRAHDRKLIKL